MLSNSPPQAFPRCLRSLAAASCLALTVSLVPLIRDASAKPVAYTAKRGKACKLRTRVASAATVASARRADQRAGAAIARYRAHIARLRRAGGRANRGAIQRNQRTITRLRRQLSCQTRYVLGSETTKTPGPLNPDRTQITSDADQALFQQWIDAASRAGIPTPVGSLQVVNAPCPIAAVSSCTTLGKPIYLDPAEPDRADAFYHELGHQLWYQTGVAQRDEFMAIIGKAGQPYRQVGGNSPHEQWAEAYRVVINVALHGPNIDKNAAYGLVVDGRRLAQLTALVKRIHQNTAPGSAPLPME